MRPDHSLLRWRRVWRIVGLVLVGVSWPSGEVRAGKLDYNRDVRPILSNKCFRCHGFDEKNRAADLRLDVAEGAFAQRDSQAAIVPFHPEQSLLVERITTRDTDLKMPPPDAPQQLSGPEMEVLRQWIREGAEYQPHWAFAPLVKPAVTGIGHESADQVPASPIDVFIERELAAKGIPPAPLAPRNVLIRRLYLDLLGLLPSAEEVDQFVKDEAPDAWERLVDRTLANPHYGERWGRHWLDQARYADSNGYSIDGARVMWPYRDWVIAALNEDLPFDQFTVEQLAGDLLPEPTKRQLIASAFHRNTMINEEGGVKADQFRHEAIVDRVATTGSVWLGLSIGCAQCHSHKYDPITHEDFHRMYAFFNATQDSNNQGATVPVLVNEVFGLSAQAQETLAQLKSLRERQGRLKSEVAKESQVVEGGQTVPRDWKRLELTSFTTGSNANLTRLPDGSVLASKDLAENDSYELSFVWPENAKSIRVVTLTHESLPKQGPGLAGNGNFVLSDVFLERDGQPIRFAQAVADHEQQGYTAQHAIDGDPQSGWAINVSPDQTKRTPQLKMNARHEISLVPTGAITPGPITLVLKHDRNAHYLIGRVALEISDQLPLKALETTSRQQELAAVTSQIDQLEKQLPGSGREFLQMVMRDEKSPPETYLLLRGDFLNPDRERGSLFPGVPEALRVATSQVEPLKSRLDLAKWLVSPQNPLTPRVVVNRVWMRYFGRGIVETENDFGLQGSLPSSPELLDWLASRLHEVRWSMKALHKEILLSKTYRRDSRISAEAWAADPQNRSLARQQRTRVDAEVVRDLMLTASGRFTPTIGGPSVFPPQPEGVFRFTQNSKPWNEEQGANRYRRTMYTMFYRSAPYPLLATFDTPDFSSACTRRQPSNTPLQALAVANDPMFVELAGGLARRVLLAGQRSPEAMAQAMWRICLSRSPTAEELEVVRQFSEMESKRLDASPADAALLRKLVRVESLPPEVSEREFAVATSLARLVMNTDEFISRN